jgi:predicted MFS family arabinose efflux permease
MDIDTTPATELALVEDVTDSETTEDSGTNNVAIAGAALIGGVLIGTYVVPAVTGWISSWFTPSAEQIAAAEAQIDAVLENTETETDKAV